MRKKISFAVWLNLPAERRFLPRFSRDYCLKNSTASGSSTNWIERTKLCGTNQMTTTYCPDLQSYFHGSSACRKLPKTSTSCTMRRRHPLVHRRGTSIPGAVSTCILLKDSLVVSIEESNQGTQHIQRVREEKRKEKGWDREKELVRKKLNWQQRISWSMELPGDRWRVCLPLH